MTGSIGDNDSLSQQDESDMIEGRANPYHAADGKFTTGGAGKTKYAPSKRRSSKGITVSSKKYAKLTGVMNTRYPGLEKGEKATIRDAKYCYTVKADGYGGMEILRKTKIK